MEFKLDGTAEEALQQIRDKHYADPFLADRRKLFRVGVNFSDQTRNIERWLVEQGKLSVFRTRGFFAIFGVKEIYA